ncbi:invasin domain 3-containing protein [Pseudomonas khavaziana]|uniref:invasin domain 3-containing protein n=1 Tax=Pseudomonas khavaziana TaxID=2842351 RepID=UPI001C3D986E|nr:invasin domain 3-containing protein [Pseudomonas khavaziana]MBV4483810.1 Ig-like domain-containing protein [Pseudomonas khavaziana]
MQFIFMSTVVVPPAVAESIYSIHAPKASVKQKVARSRIYTLQSGETAVSVAKAYNMSLEALRQLNQFRLFAHGFDHLQAGEELDVPLAPRPLLPSFEGGGNDSQAQKMAVEAQSKKLAGIASQAGTLMSSSTKGDAVASMTRSVVVGEVGNQLQQWLGRFGTARVQVDIDRHFSPRNYQLDFLHPFYNQGNTLTFMQASVHRTNERTQGNLGIGRRHFTPAYMLGQNFFIDYDMSYRNARLGLGVEYWRDSLKLSANVYERLTGWRSSPDLADYRERPANGWDIRAKAWFPSLPQLGGGLTYEQYYGGEVGLFGSDNRQHNPRSITAGVNYTPIPLLTFNVKRRLGQSGRNEAQFGMDITYRPGVTWSKQIDPKAITAMRSLVGSRFDLVDRNNNIVLDYRHEKILSLYTASSVTGFSGEHKSLDVSVSSKYGLAAVEWSVSSLRAAGGNIVDQGGGAYSVVLPPYHALPQGVNTYTISGVAVDRKGNRSRARETQVTVQAPLVNLQHSTFIPAQSTIKADGKSKRVLTLSIKNSQAQPLSIPVSDIKFNVSPLNAATISAPVIKSAGVYEVVVTAGTRKGSVTVVPMAGNVKLSSAIVQLTMPALDATKSTLQVTPETIPADGKTHSILTLSAINGNGLPVSGLDVSHIAWKVSPSDGLAIASGSIVVSATKASTAGIYSAELSGMRAGKVSVMPQLNGTNAAAVAATVTLTALPPAEAQSELVATPSSIPADGVTASRLKLTLKDSLGQAMKGQTVVFSTTVGTVGSTIDNHDGTYSADLKSSMAGAASIGVMVGGARMGGLNTTVTLTALPPAEAQSELVATPSSIPADGVTASRLKLTLKDSLGQAMKGQTVVFSTTVGTVGSTIDNHDGTYSADLKSSMAGAASIGVMVGGARMGGLNTTVTLTALPPAEAQSELVATPSSIPADGVTASRLKLTLKDSLGQAMKGQTVVFSTTVGTVGSTIDNHDGTYSADLKSSMAGAASIGVMVGGARMGGLNTTVTLTALPPAEAQSELVATPSSIPADGVTASRLKLTLKDSLGQAMKGQTVVFSTTVGTVGSTIDNHDGTYSADLKSSMAGAASIGVMVGGARMGGLNTTVTLTALPPAEAQSELVATPSSIPADGVTASRLKLTLKDSLGQAMKGQTVVFSTTVGTVGSTIDNHDGTYSADLKSSMAGAASIGVMVGGARMGGLNTTVTLTALPPAEAQSELVATPSSIPADGVTASRLKLTLKDSLGQAMKGQTVVFSTTVGTVGSTIDNHDGTYSADLKSSMAGAASIGVMVGGARMGGLNTTVTLTALPPAEAQSELVATPSSIPADGVTASRLKLTLKDSLGQAMKGQTVVFSTTVGTVGSTIDNHDGTYSADLKSSMAGAASIGVMVGGARMGGLNTTVTLTALPPAEAQSELVATPSSIPADGVTASRLKLTLKDSLGQAMKGQTVVFSTTVGTVGSTIDNHDGTYSADLKSSMAGAASIGVMVGGARMGGLNTTVTLTALPPAEAQSELVATPSSIPADGVTASRLKLTLKDSLGQAMKGQTVVFSTTVGTVGSTIDNHDGTYSADLKSSMAGAASIGVMVGGARMGGLNTTVTLTALPPAEAQSELVATPSSIPADGVTASRLKLTLKDSLGQAMKGQTVVFSTTVGTVGSTIDNHDGTYSADLKSSMAGAASIGVMVGGARMGGLNTTVTLTALPPAEAQSELVATPSSIPADGVTASRLKLTLKDSLGQAMKGQTVVFSTTVGTVGSTIDNQDGTYSADLKSSMAGAASIGVMVGGARMGGLNTTVTLTAKPVVSNVQIVGTGEANSSLGATYKYEGNGTGTDASRYQWKFENDNHWIAPVAAAAKNINWTPDSTYAGYQVRLEITPKGQNQSLEGDIAYSNSITIYEKPVVSNVQVVGTGEANSSLDATYTYEGNGTGTDASKYQWKYKNGNDWIAPVAAAAKNINWTPDSTYAGYQVRLEITPKGQNQSLEGDMVYSNSITIYKKPVVSNIKVVGTGNANSPLGATYNYEGNGTGTDASKYQWKYKNANSWIAPVAEAAKNLNWTPDSSYAGYEVRLEITPKGQYQSLEGDIAYSDSISIKGKKIRIVEYKHRWDAIAWFPSKTRWAYYLGVKVKDEQGNGVSGVKICSVLDGQESSGYTDSDGVMPDRAFGESGNGTPQYSVWICNGVSDNEMPGFGDDMTKGGQWWQVIPSTHIFGGWVVF